MPAQAMPAGYAGVTSYLIVDDPVRALDFYEKAFGTTVTLRLSLPDGRIAHAEFSLSGGHVMLSGEWPEMGARSPKSYGGTPVSLMFYVEDVDARFAQAVAAGATVQRAVRDQFYGDRSGTLVDPFGHVWTIATHEEDLSPAEVQQRMAAAMASGQ